MGPQVDSVEKVSAYVIAQQLAPTQSITIEVTSSFTITTAGPVKVDLNSQGFDVVFDCLRRTFKVTKR